MKTNSVKHTIEFTTNIPGSKVSTLDPKNISYSDLFTKSINMDSTMYIDNATPIDDFGSMNREEIKNTLFNKTKYHKFIKGKQGIPIKDNNKDDIILDNNKDDIIFSYLTNIFTTYPKSNNIKQTENLKKNIKNGLKFDIPFKNDTYTYLHINGTYYTISRVIFRNNSIDKLENKKFFELYDDYTAWKRSTQIQRKTALNASENGLTKRLEIIQSTIKEKINIKGENKELITYLESVSKIKHDYAKSKKTSSYTSERIDNMLEAFNVINKTIHTDIGDLTAVSKLVEAVHDVDSGWSSLNTDATLFRNFRLRRELFVNFKKLLDQHVKKMTLYDDVNKDQYTDMYKDPNNFKGESMYKPFIDLNVYVSTHYEIYGTHTLPSIKNDIQNRVYVPIVKEEDANHYEKINLHFDLIKGKITDDNKGKIGCEYSDINLAARFDKLIGAVDDDPSLFEYLPLHEAVSNTGKPKQKTKGGQRKTKNNINLKNKTRRNKK